MSEGHDIISTDIIRAPAQYRRKAVKSKAGPCASQGVIMSEGHGIIKDKITIQEEKEYHGKRSDGFNCSS